MDRLSQMWPNVTTDRLQDKDLLIVDGLCAMKFGMLRRLGKRDSSDTLAFMTRLHALVKDGMKKDDCSDELDKLLQISRALSEELLDLKHSQPELFEAEPRHVDDWKAICEEDILWSS